jgi:predicted nuclease of predicted toxin-antitoxin system
MNLYLDDDSAKASLVRLLTKVSHQVVIPVDAGISGVSDARHLMHAVQQDRVLLTKNHDDFEDLHLLVHITGGKHPGLLVVRSDNDPRRDMKDGDIVRALSNLLRAGAPVANEFLWHATECRSGTG